MILLCISYPVELLTPAIQNPNTPNHNQNLKWWTFFFLPSGTQDRCPFPDSSDLQYFLTVYKLELLAVSFISKVCVCLRLCDAFANWLFEARLRQMPCVNKWSRGDVHLCRVCPPDAAIPVVTIAALRWQEISTVASSLKAPGRQPKGIFDWRCTSVTWYLDFN